MDTTQGECIAIAQLFDRVLKLVGLGIPSSRGAVRLLYVYKNKIVKEDTREAKYDTRTCTVGFANHTDTEAFHSAQNSEEKLNWTDLNNVLNNYEACYRYVAVGADPVFYAAGPNKDNVDGRSMPYANAKAVMQAYAIKSYWVICNPVFAPIDRCNPPGPVEVWP